MAPSLNNIFLQLLLLQILLSSRPTFELEILEATIDDIQRAFSSKQLTSRSLVQFYLDRIKKLNPDLNAVIEVNPDALRDADAADLRRTTKQLPLRALNGIPVLLKDNIATKDRLNTTAGSLALLGSVVPRDAGVVNQLRKSGAVILGKASLSEWANFRSFNAPSGWSARGHQGKNPYNSSTTPCGSSSGSAIAAAANMASVTLGSETDGSIICPASYNSVVGIKPTVGLTSLSGVIPVSQRQDTIGPICRTVSDAVRVLDAIVGYDPRDAKATRVASKFIPTGGYRQFLRVDGVREKRIGILRKFFNSDEDPMVSQIFEKHFDLLRQNGAVLVDHLTIANADVIKNKQESGEFLALGAEFKEKIGQFGQGLFREAEETRGIGPLPRAIIQVLSELSKNGLEKLMEEELLDAVITTEERGCSLLAIGGYPGITVPAGYKSDGSPVGISFGGLRGSEPKLIEIAYGFEQATLIRKPPVLDMDKASTF